MAAVGDDKSGATNWIDGLRILMKLPIPTTDGLTRSWSAPDRR